MKYICVINAQNKQEIILFPNNIDHDVMAESVSYIRNKTHGNWMKEVRSVLSAGFVSFSNQCYGKSESLGLESRPEEDSELLYEQFYSYKKL